MNHDKPLRVVPRPVREGTIPLVAIEGAAHDCGREYAEIVLRRYPGFREYLDMAYQWNSLPPLERRLIEAQAPQLLDLYRGLIEVAGPPADASPTSQKSVCTSFGVSGSVTLDGQPISGQTKDTPLDRIPRYTVLRIRIRDAPTILVLAYPGEVLGHGMWSTGMSIFRHTLYSGAQSTAGLEFVVFGLLALSGRSVQDAIALARTHGLKGCGAVLVSDANGESVSIEWNAGGVSVIPQYDGIATRANHPQGKETQPYEAYPFAATKEDSQHRMHRLWELLHAERGRLTPQRALMAFADHSTYPRGICKHYNEDGSVTTSAVVAEPTQGKLHVVRGQPCCNWPVTYTV